MQVMQFQRHRPLHKPLKAPQLNGCRDRSDDCQRNKYEDSDRNVAAAARQMSVQFGSGRSANAKGKAP